MCVLCVCVCVLGLALGGRRGELFLFTLKTVFRGCGRLAY